ncbi:hypothetical protein C8034_v009050 [Colletotrichum sidae]|uniref:Nucleolar protein n=1 Tax=Colletotrichum sidae TaxID=1347389 RepID=A0A4R8T231_9PEZI|nr:hypothetical protein C8034_v009050 [Colletotrichum sidae]
MFEVPDAKRVRRDELDSASDDEAPARGEEHDAALLAKLHARMAGVLDLSGPQAETPAPQTEATEPMDQDEPAEVAEEFEFRLFSKAPVTKIALVDEDAAAGDGDMLRKRPLGYYIADISEEVKAQFREAAMEPEDVLRRAEQKWWGMEMPWRVTHVEGAKIKGTKEGDKGEEGKRRRPGKRKRIAMRMKEREKKKKAEEAEMAKMTKEEHLKEKKKRLNRLKKLRRRAKGKDGKGGEGEDGEGSDGEGSEGDE